MVCKLVHVTLQEDVEGETGKGCARWREREVQERENGGCVCVWCVSIHGVELAGPCNTLRPSSKAAGWRWDEEGCL